MENNNQREIIEKSNQPSFDEKWNKRFQKIDNYIFNVDILNKIIAIFASVFVICFFAFSIKINQQRMIESNSYQKMLAELEARQLNDIYNNTTNDSSAGSGQNETPIFKNAIDAVCFAYDRFRNYTTFEIEGGGIVNSSAVGQDVEIIVSSHTAKFADGIVYNNTVRKETQTNFGQTDATETVYTGTEKYRRIGTNVRKSGDKYVADYSGPFKKVNSEVTSYAFYEVNKDTALYSKSFAFVRNKDGSIAYYKATILLDSQKATQKYAKEIQEAGGTSLPNVTYLELSCIIDRNGDFLSYNAIETMIMNKTIIVDITATAQNNLTYYFFFFFETPKVAKPQYK